MKKGVLKILTAFCALGALSFAGCCDESDDDETAKALVVWAPLDEKDSSGTVTNAVVSYSIGIQDGGTSHHYVTEYRNVGTSTCYEWSGLENDKEYTFLVYATYADGTNTRLAPLERVVNAHVGGHALRVMGYFRDSGSTLEEQSLHLAVTTDGLHWQSLNGNTGVFQLSTIGGNRVRDPYIVKKPDGKYLMIATDWTLYEASTQPGNHRLYDGTTSDKDDWGYVTNSYWDVNTTCLIFADSDDMITWSNERQIQMVSDADKIAFKDANGNYQFCWAPEIIYDDGNDIFTDPDTGVSYKYGVIWSGQGETDGTTSKSYNAKRNAYETTSGHSTSYRRTFVNYTNDFETFTEPQVFFDPGNSNIDCSVCKGAGDKWYVFYKDEKSGYYGMGENWSTSLLPNSFNSNYIWSRAYNGTQVQEAAGGTYNQGEGMFCFQPYSGVNKWLCVLDAHDAHQTKVFATFETSDFALWKENDDTSWPTGDIRHGASVPVTLTEMQRLIEAFGF